jgi:hypothetical protein
MIVALAVAIEIAPASVHVRAETRIISLAVADQSSLDIKPCMPVYVLLACKVSTDFPGEPMDVLAARAAKRLAHSVKVDEKVVLDRVSDGPPSNEVATFAAYEPAVTEPVGTPENHPVAYCLVTFSYNARTHECVFLQPGSHSVTIGEPGAEISLELVVHEPTGDDSRVISGLQRPDVAEFLQMPEDRRRAHAETLQNVSALASFDTQYRAHLRMALGIAKVYGPPPCARESPEYLLRLRNLLEECRTCFASVASGDLKSPMEAHAALSLGLLEGLAADQETDDDRARAGFERAVDALERASHASLGAGYAKRAREAKAYVHSRAQQRAEVEP